MLVMLYLRGHKKFNVEHHYKNKHASTYDSIVGDDRRKMIENLKKTFSNDVCSITTFNDDDDDDDMKKFL